LETLWTVDLRTEILSSSTIKEYQMRVLIPAMAAAVASAIVAVPVSAAPTCFGKRATIVGTNRDRTRPVELQGTSRNDVIVGLRGPDIEEGLERPQVEMAMREHGIDSIEQVRSGPLRLLHVPMLRDLVHDAPRHHRLLLRGHYSNPFA
jgi:hypothetical protein